MIGFFLDSSHVCLISIIRCSLVVEIYLNFPQNLCSASSAVDNWIEFRSCREPFSFIPYFSAFIFVTKLRLAQNPIEIFSIFLKDKRRIFENHLKLFENAFLRRNYPNIEQIEIIGVHGLTKQREIHLTLTEPVKYLIKDNAQFYKHLIFEIFSRISF